MVIDLDVSKRSLPYEVSIRIEIVPKANISLQSISLSSTYIELFVDGVNVENGSLNSPSWYKEFHIPMTHLDFSKQFGVH